LPKPFKKVIDQVWEFEEKRTVPVIISRPENSSVQLYSQGRTTNQGNYFHGDEHGKGLQEV
jgi:hypothetical protein